MSVLGPTLPPVLRGEGVLSAEKKRQGREGDSIPPPSPEVKNTWIYTSTPLYVFMV
jgi:hypothetical protein